MVLGRGKKKTAKPKKKAGGASRKEKRAQLRLAFSMTRKADSKMLPLVLGSFLITVAIFVLFGLLIDYPIYVGILGLMFGLVVAAAVFGRRVQKTAFMQVEGQLGAAAAVLQNMRGNWRVTPAVGFTKEQDLLHQVVGRPGIILVGEGAPNRVRNLVGARKRELARLVGDTPIYDVSVGDAEGQLTLRELERHFSKLPQNIKPARVNELSSRLKALKPANLPIPKGPMPTRVPRGKTR